MEILANELKGRGGMEPLIFASKFKGQGSVSQAYRNLFAARIRQSRLSRRFHRDLTSLIQRLLSERNHSYHARHSALERKALDSLNTIRNSEAL
jgi:hypothetical protein